MQTWLDPIIHKGNLEGVNLIEAESTVMAIRGWGGRKHATLLLDTTNTFWSRVTIMNNNNISILK